MTGRFECGVCWHVYDPAEGDAQGQFPPGTPFAALPPDWRCPGCDTAKARFLALDDDPWAARMAALREAYAAADAAMRGLPVHNPALEIAVVGPRLLDDAAACVVVTPWCMNLALVAPESDAWRDLPVGAEVDRVLPAGAIGFTVAALPGFGRLLTASLFSPMGEFAEASVARATAEAALDAAMTPPAPPPPPQHGRRGLFAGGA